MREMKYIRTKDEDGIGCIFDQEAMNDYLLMWVNETTIRHTIYVLTRTVLTWRDHIDDSHHHQQNYYLRRKRKILLVNGLRDMISTLIVSADIDRRHKILSEISIF